MTSKTFVPLEITAAGRAPTTNAPCSGAVFGLAGVADGFTLVQLFMVICGETLFTKI
jgi:hypothetical protein